MTKNKLPLTPEEEKFLRENLPNFYRLVTLLLKQKQKKEKVGTEETSSYSTTYKNELQKQEY